MVANVRNFMCFAFVCLIAVGPATGQTIWLVDGGVTSSGTGTGSWSNAFETIGEALFAADETRTSPPFDQIWIKAGTYHPANPTTGFVLESNVEVYGGFDGTEALSLITPMNDPRQFDSDGYLVHETILSGELDNPNDFSDNVKLLVTAPAAVDGYVRRGGAA